MVRLTKIYTRKGDDGTTALGTGERVGKDNAQVEAYGEVDELNAAIGAAVAHGLSEDVAPVMRRVQSELLNVGGLLCMLERREDDNPMKDLVQDRHVQQLEAECDRFNAELGPLENFILPGGTPGAAFLHIARTIARRAERRVVSLSRDIWVPEPLVRYLNRLSDLLFILARYENRARGVEDVLWDKSV
jgi:cob(I)alamin adenosyltransferase